MRDEAAGAAGVDEGAAISFEEGLGGDPEDVVERVDDDDQVGGPAGAEFGGGVVEGDAAFETWRSQGGPLVPTPMFLTLPANSLPARATTFTATGWPMVRWPRSSSPTLALTSQLLRSGIWATAMPARAVSPSWKGGSCMPQYIMFWLVLAWTLT